MSGNVKMGQVVPAFDAHGLMRRIAEQAIVNSCVDIEEKLDRMIALLEELVALAKAVPDA